MGMALSVSVEQTPPPHEAGTALEVVMPLGEEDHFRLRAGFKSTAHECRHPVMSAL